MAEVCECRSRALREILMRVRAAGVGQQCSKCRPEKALPSSRVLPWETQLHRERTHGMPPLAAKKATKESAFQNALAEALSLASDPAHVATLSRVYAQTVTTTTKGGPNHNHPARRRRRRRRRPTPDDDDDALVREAERQEAKARAHLEAAVRNCEREYRAILDTAANEDNPEAAGDTSRHLVRAIRRFHRASEALRDFDRVTLRSASTPASAPAWPGA
mmetsp:Transcript_22040/g.70950  ORF Transcript_22040/g.70950 Transcript_22040/m.70950 type:complete len:219 (-) Transcript_22040:431-1087(-)